MMQKITPLLFLIFGWLSLAAQPELGYAFPDRVKTTHELQAGNVKLKYEATAGHMLMYNKEGGARAQIFFVNYNVLNKSGLPDKNRPITFVFNGGPGSSSVWLHMGALGPKRIAMQANGYPEAPPYNLVENEHTWLTHTDLVFIDPVETGFSRPAGETDKKEFTGYNEDLESVGDFIHAFVTEAGRWPSPKFLAGESYGTTRASGLSGYLQDRHGMFLNGVVLISAILNFQTAYFTEGNDLPYSLFLPSYAAIAYHHGKIDSARFPSLEALLREVETFALGPYNHALMQGDQLSPGDAAAITEKLALYTGLDPETIKKRNWRISVPIFTKALLLDEGYTIGRFDGTVMGRDKSSAETTYEFDPSYNYSIYGPYTMAINTHLFENLQYRHHAHVYEILTGKVWPWNYGNAQNRFLDNSQVLRQAIHKNPNLKVLICNGYYDLATPYFATKYTVDHMFLHPDYRNNIRQTYYKGGHMMYSIDSELRQFTKDVRQFYENR